MGRIPEKSFCLLEEQGWNIGDNIRVKHDVTEKDMAWEEKEEKNVVVYIYCEELTRGFLQNMDQNKRMSNSNNSFSIFWNK